MNFLYKALAIILGLCIAVATALAYMVRRVDTEISVVYDGLGRVLIEPPIWARFLLTEERVWAGAGWHLLDILWFFGGFAIALWLYGLSED